MRPFSFSVQAKGIVRQHIESFDHFINVDLKNILEANKEVRSDVSTCIVVEFWCFYFLWSISNRAIVKFLPHLCKNTMMAQFSHIILAGGPELFPSLHEHSRRHALFD